jgi:hypothetical protein
MGLSNRRMAMFVLRRSVDKRQGHIDAHPSHQKVLHPNPHTKGKLQRGARVP